MRVSSYSLDLTSQYDKSKRFSSATTENATEKRTKISIKESQSLNLSASGNITTEDKKIAISLNANILEANTTEIEIVNKKSAPKMIDPLVINLKGFLAQVSKKELFDFDINSDGKKDKISTLDTDNGFLALDKNTNNSIDDGSELFGTHSGNGFSDLAVLDKNKDNLIDGKDSAYENLRLWERSASTNQLLTLKEAKIGAILLDNISSEFELKDDDRINAKLQKSGVVLFEDGKAGWVSHVDFAVQENDNPSGATGENRMNGDLNTHSANISTVNTVQNTQIEKLKKRLIEIEAKINKVDSKEERKYLEGEKVKITEQINSIMRRESLSTRA